MKLAMVSSIARGNNMLVTESNVYEALSWLIQAETNFPEIFTQSGMTAEGRVIEDLCFIIKRHHDRTKKPVSEHILVNYLKDRVPSHSIVKIIEVMVKARKIKFQLLGGLPAYEPIPDRDEQG